MEAARLSRYCSVQRELARIPTRSASSSMGEHLCDRTDPLVASTALEPSSRLPFDPYMQWKDPTEFRVCGWLPKERPPGRQGVARAPVFSLEIPWSLHSIHSEPRRCCISPHAGIITIRIVISEFDESGQTQKQITFRVLQIFDTGCCTAASGRSINSRDRALRVRLVGSFRRLTGVCTASKR